MTNGFAFLAYPAEYRSSGVMTFMINQNGVVVQKDLGINTSTIASEMSDYNPDHSWGSSSRAIVRKDHWDGTNATLLPA